MGNVIFEDLEIDFKNMMKDPETFCSAVEAKAEELKGTLKENNSVEVFMKGLPKSTFNKAESQKPLLEIYEAAETMPLENLQELADLFRDYAKSIEALIYSRAIKEITSTQGVTDKQLIHDQYCRLRDSYAKVLKSFDILDIKHNGKPLAAMPGNYGSPVGLSAPRYAFFFDGDDEPYINYRVVCRKLGIEPFSTYMDTVDYLKSNPGLGVTVKEYSK